MDNPASLFMRTEGGANLKDFIQKGYIGNPSQLVTLRRVTVSEGKAKGSEIIEVKTAGGLELDILPDTGLDIGQCRYKGINMSWMSKNGYDAPSVMSPYETEFLHTFPGGLLYTCGLRSAGPANRDAGEWHPLHGRYHGIAAEEVCAERDDEEIVIRGLVRETALFGHCLTVRRTMRIPVFGASVTVTTENLKEVTSGAFLKSLSDRGCKAVVFVEFVPVTEESTHLAPGDEEREYLRSEIARLRAEHPEMVYISFPGDEKSSDGCVAAGRGFFHINSHGCAEPCPFSPYSDINVRNTSLREALHSPLFLALQSGDILLDDHDGGCVLYEKRELVEQLLAGSGT